MSSVLLVGAFGQGNPGDEALCAACCAALADHDVVAASSDPVDTAARHRVRAVDASAIATARAAWHADVVVVAGGTIFKTLHPSAGRRPASLLRNAAALVAGVKAHGGRVAMVGVGADDLRGRQARSLARWLVRHTDLLVLRDEESAAVLAAAGAPTPFWIGADPAWALHEDLPPVATIGAAEPPARGSVTVALSHLAGDRRLLGHLADALAPLVDRWSVQLQPWQVGAGDADDVELAHDLAALLPEGVTILEPPGSVAEAAASFAGDDLVVALRFHAIVAAALAGTRCLAIAHEPKLAGLARRLRQLAVPADASGPVLAHAVERAIVQAPIAASDVADQVTAARRSLDLMRLLLDTAAHEDPRRLAGLALSDGGGSW